MLNTKEKEVKDLPKTKRADRIKAISKLKSIEEKKEALKERYKKLLLLLEQLEEIDRKLENINIGLKERDKRYLSYKEIKEYREKNKLKYDKTTILRQINNLKDAGLLEDIRYNRDKRFSSFKIKY